MTCPECIQAEKRPTHGIYSASCTECTARAIAQSPDAFFSAKEGRCTGGLKKALQSVFGEEWKEGLARVKHWADKIGGVA